MVVKTAIKLGQSILFWLALFLIAAEYSTKALLPLATIPHDRQRPNQITQEALVYKLEELSKLSKSPDVLILGSSLPMAAFRYCDNMWQRQTVADENARKHNVSVFQSYCRGVYLEKQLSESQRHNVSVFNFTSAACMPSDASLILSKAIEIHKVPKVVIIGFGPRDFMDNLVPEEGRTPAFNALADWPSLSGNLPASLSPDTLRELALSASSHLYRQRSDWSLFFSEWTCNLIRPVVSPAKASPIDQIQIGKTGKIPVAKIQTNDKPRYEAWHIEDYRKRYNPPNFTRYTQEMERLAHLLDTLRDRQITAVVVNMPITETNRQLIPPTLVKRYQSDLALYAKRFDADYVDLSTSPLFTDDDFLDTVHVLPQGGKKVLDELAKDLSQSSRVTAVLDANSVKSIGRIIKREKAL